jgi:dinuclear metal center YbgI/SA1388 family protein
MTSRVAVTLRTLVSALEHRFPAAWAESWDRVGLIVGESDTDIEGVLVTLDASAEAVDRAAASGANVLVTHHPPYLEPPELVRACAGPEGTLEAALRQGVAVIALHTNLDRSPAGASALAEALGLTILGPLESATEPVTLVVTYAPRGSADQLREAMANSGAGRIGQYEGCAFVSEGTGHFAALEGASTSVSDAGEGVGEVRIEMVAPASAVADVIQAARVAHPYDEPVILALDGERARGAARLGRVCTRDTSATLADLARHVSDTLGVACRVWGDGARVVDRIAVANGSAGSLIADATRSADTLIAGEVRYHDALAAVASGLAVIEVGHDASEWPLVAVLGQAVAEVLPADVGISVESAHTGWWTMEGANVGG